MYIAHMFSKSCPSFEKKMQKQQQPFVVDPIKTGDIFKLKKTPRKSIPMNVVRQLQTPPPILQSVARTTPTQSQNFHSPPSISKHVQTKVKPTPNAQYEEQVTKGINALFQATFHPKVAQTIQENLASMQTTPERHQPRQQSQIAAAATFAPIAQQQDDTPAFVVPIKPSPQSKQDEVISTPSVPPAVTAVVTPKQNIELVNWWFEFIVEDLDGFISLNFRAIGVRNDLNSSREDKVWKSSFIVERVSSRIFKTTSNTHEYELVGNCNTAEMKQENPRVSIEFLELFADGIPQNWNRLISMESQRLYKAVQLKLASPVQQLPIVVADPITPLPEAISKSPIVQSQQHEEEQVIDDSPKQQHADTDAIQHSPEMFVDESENDDDNEKHEDQQLVVSSPEQLQHEEEVKEHSDEIIEQIQPIRQITNIDDESMHEDQANNDDDNASQDNVEKPDSGDEDVDRVLFGGGYDDDGDDQQQQQQPAIETTISQNTPHAVVDMEITQGHGRISVKKSGTKRKKSQTSATIATMMPKKKKRKVSKITSSVTRITYDVSNPNVLEHAVPLSMDDPLDDLYQQKALEIEAQELQQEQAKSETKVKRRRVLRSNKNK